MSAAAAIVDAVATDDDFLTVAQVAELAGVKAVTIYQHVQRSTMPEPDARFGQTPVWRRSTVVAWLAERPGPGRRPKPD